MNMLRRLTSAAVALVATAFIFAEHTTAADKPINITLITKDPDNHFWTSMVEGAREAAKGQDVQITVAAGRDQSDAEGQIQALNTRSREAIRPF
jgi:fructose transport system substrate-binding protein